MVALHTKTYESQHYRLVKIYLPNGKDHDDGLYKMNGSDIAGAQKKPPGEKKITPVSQRHSLRQSGTHCIHVLKQPLPPPSVFQGRLNGADNVEHHNILPSGKIKIIHKSKNNGLVTISFLPDLSPRDTGGTQVFVRNSTLVRELSRTETLYFMTTR
jgi:hypothetical protein